MTKVTKDAGLYVKMSERSHVIVVLNMRVDGSILVYAVEREVKKYLGLCPSRRFYGFRATGLRPVLSRVWKRISTGR
jgi:hypothetical protein